MQLYIVTKMMTFGKVFSPSL